MPSTHFKAEGTWGSCNASADGKRSDRFLATGKPAYIAEKALKYIHGHAQYMYVYQKHKQ